jgi:putative membrane protein
MKSGHVVALLVVLLVLFLFSFADQGHMWGWGNMMAFGHGVGYLWIIVLIIIGVVVYWIIQNEKSTSEGDKEAPLDILKRRYAKGEITKEQYEEMKKKLEE